MCVAFEIRKLARFWRWQSAIKMKIYKPNNNDNLIKAVDECQFTEQEAHFHTFYPGVQG